MDSFIWLVFGHFFGDYAFQNDYLAKGKATDKYIMLCHCIVWAGVVCILLSGIDKWALWKAYFLIIGHYIIDTIKCKHVKDSTVGSGSINDKYNIKLNYLDQLLHLGQLIIVYIF